MTTKTLPASLVLGVLATLAIAGCNQRRNDSSSQTEQPDVQTKASAGVTFYYGVVKGAIVREHPTEHAEANMHSGPPASPAAYHIVLALFETATNQRITDATVEVRLGRLGGPVNTWLPMEAMRDAGSESFGRYAELPDAGRYLLEFRVNRAGRTRPITEQFAFERPE